MEFGSVQNLLSSRLLFNTVTIKNYNIIIFPVVLYVGETWALILRKGTGMKLLESGLQRRIFVTERDELREVGGN